MTSGVDRQTGARSLRRMLVPLALAQFICSFAGSNMNVMINDISHDLHTTVQGVQVYITLFLLVMAALMIPCGKLTDRWGRKRCFTSVYGVGAVLSAVSPGLGVLILGNSILEGVGAADQADSPEGEGPSAAAGRSGPPSRHVVKGSGHLADGQLFIVPGSQSERAGGNGGDQPYPS